MDATQHPQDDTAVDSASGHTEDSNAALNRAKSDAVGVLVSLEWFKSTAERRFDEMTDQHAKDLAAVKRDARLASVKQSAELNHTRAVLKRKIMELQGSLSRPKSATSLLSKGSWSS